MKTFFVSAYVLCMTALAAYMLYAGGQASVRANTTVHVWKIDGYGYGPYHGRCAVNVKQRIVACATEHEDGENLGVKAEGWNNAKR